MTPPDAQTAPMRYCNDVPQGSAVGAAVARIADTNRTYLFMGAAKAKRARERGSKQCREREREIYKKKERDKHKKREKEREREQEEVEDSHTWALSRVETDFARTTAFK